MATDTETTRREPSSDESTGDWSGHDLLLDVVRDLFEAPTRGAVERTVCERLASSAEYEFTWVGEPTPARDEVVPRVGATASESDVEAVEAAVPATGVVHGPAMRAVRNGTVAVDRESGVAPTADSWPQAGLEGDVRSVAAVPLVHAGTAYGVLVVYAARPRAFEERERTALEVLGEATGFAIHAAENRSLLVADSVVELEFAVTDSELAFVRASERLGCDLTVAGHVASASGDWSVYLQVEGAPPASLREVTADDPNVDGVRVLVDDGDGGLVELVMDCSALSEITDHGGVVTSGRVREGRGRFCVEVPATKDVRRLVERLRAAYPESRLVARREFDRPVRTARQLRRSIDDLLTDRQREALFRAYHAGYFEWPRPSDAADVAESMDVAETTYHYHLRNALRKLLSELTDRDDRRKTPT